MPGKKHSAIVRTQRIFVLDYVESWSITYILTVPSLLFPHLQARTSLTLSSILLFRQHIPSSPIMNRKQFLAQLLKKENSVQPTKGQECLICKEEYGTRPSGTEPAERQIRLPCNAKHMVGSSCISTWLDAHNSCPICRYEFFPKEKTRAERPEPQYIELLDDDDITDEGEDLEDGEFVDEDGATNYEDENMSDVDEVGDDDEDMSD